MKWHCKGFALFFKLIPLISLWPQIICRSIGRYFVRKLWICKLSINSDVVIRYDICYDLLCHQISHASGLCWILFDYKQNVSVDFLYDLFLWHFRMCDVDRNVINIVLWIIHHAIYHFLLNVKLLKLLISEPFYFINFYNVVLKCYAKNISFLIEWCSFYLILSLCMYTITRYCFHFVLLNIFLFCSFRKKCFCNVVNNAYCIFHVVKLYSYNFFLMVFFYVH